MKTRNHGHDLGSQTLKERYLQCFGVRANNATLLRGAVRTPVQPGRTTLSGIAPSLSNEALQTNKRNQRRPMKHHHRGVTLRPIIPKLWRLFHDFAPRTASRFRWTSFLLFFHLACAMAQMPPGFDGSPTNIPLASWSFKDNTNWTSDQGHLPTSFTNVVSSDLGYAFFGGTSLAVDTNLPAWLNYNILEPGSEATNLVLNSPGSLAFWYAPADWSSTNAGGTGPGDCAQLIDVGELTTNAAYGYWGLSIDPPGGNLWFVAQDGAGNTYTMSTPVSWTTNYFHFVALTYSSTNVSLYLDGQLATNDPGGLHIWPDSEVVSNGVFFGSDTNGQMQGQGLFNLVATYSYPLDAKDVEAIFNWYYPYYMISPLNIGMSIASAPSSQTTFTPLTDVIAGTGYLQANGPVAAHNYGTNAYQVWITNVTAAVVSNGTTAISFTIEGGQDGYMYDVFATGALGNPLTNAIWAWLGQGGHFTNYTVAITSPDAFLILGTPQSSTLDGLTDAYKLLVLHVSTNYYSTDGTGMADGWEVLYFGQIGVAANGDPDGDGLTTFQEWLMNSKGYNPVKWNSFTNSVVGDGYQNYSGDGLANLMQAAFGGNMLTNNPTWKANASGDGFSDEYKTMVGLSTNSAAAVPGLPAYSKNPIQ